MKRGICLLLACFFACACAGCSSKTSRVEETVFAMDTVMQLQVEGENAQQALQEVKQLLLDLDQRWSNVRTDSAISRLNAGEDVLTDTEKAFLDEVQTLSNRTDGAFDPMLHSCIALWGFQSDEQCVPVQEELELALNDKQWNLGAAIKGYAGRLAVEKLKKANIDRAILNLGGNVQTYGKKENGEPWTVAIQNPAGEGTIGVVSVVGTTAVVTSGDYQRYFEEGGVRYHHILDPKTGMPARSGLSSVTVICKDGLTADVLSTALFVMGLEQAADFWRQRDDFEAVFITAEGQVYATEGAALSGCEFEVISREN